jgi:hypothetical protein
MYDFRKKIYFIIHAFPDSQQGAHGGNPKREDKQGLASSNDNNHTLFAAHYSFFINYTRKQRPDQ